METVLPADKVRDNGVHYTPEPIIMDVIGPLFLDGLKRELAEIKSESGHRRNADADGFRKKLSGLRFLDPSCGTGNFLAVTYRKLMALDMEAAALVGNGGSCMVNAGQMYGIEIDSDAAEAAILAVIKAGRGVGNQHKVDGAAWHHIIEPHITCADALEIDWNETLPSGECSYVIGNPPYGGANRITAKKRRQVKRTVRICRGGGTLDYAAAWLVRAGGYIPDDASIGFVVTGGLFRGEQVGKIWQVLYDRCRLEITYAYKPFGWSHGSEAGANVGVVILGLCRAGRHVGRRRLFGRESGAIIEENPEFISPYIVGTDNPRLVVMESQRVMNGLPPIRVGTQPIDGNHYIFTDSERKEFLNAEPDAEPLFRPYFGAYDFLYGRRRSILHLSGVPQDVLAKLPHVTERVEMVRKHRTASRRSATRAVAESPQEYHIATIPKERFIVVPIISSERRRYVPMGFADPPAIPSNGVMAIDNAGLCLLGLLSSRMHMVWLDVVGGCFESSFAYSAGIVYNTFPVPECGYGSLGSHMHDVLDARASHVGTTLARLYDPDYMPADLAEAHASLDCVTDGLYRNGPFSSDMDRFGHLLGMYGTMVHGRPDAAVDGLADFDLRHKRVTGRQT